MRQTDLQHISHAQAVIVHVKLDAAGAQLRQQLGAAPVSQLFQIALAGGGLALLGVRLNIPGINVHLPPGSAGGGGVAHPDRGTRGFLASALYKGYVGVVCVGECPAGVEQIAPLRAVPVVRVKCGTEAFKEQPLAAAGAVQHNAEAQITGTPDGFAVVEETTAGGLLGKYGVEPLFLAQLQTWPRLHGGHKAAHGLLGVLLLDLGGCAALS